MLGDELVARIAHEANRHYCVSIGDTSQAPWEAAEEWQRTSAINGVRFVVDNPDAPDSATHDSWMAEKVAAGWVHGSEKNAEAKTHPCIVPFDQLPIEQQRKDRLFRSVVTAALSALA